MKKLKEVLSKNNYLVSKIAGGVVAGVAAIIVIGAITTKNKDVATEDKTTSHEEITTTQEEITSTEQIVEENTSSDELSSNIEVTSEEEITTSIVADSGETSTKETTTKQITTVKPTTTAKQTTTVKPTTTTAPTTTTKPTTTKQPETTTEEETTKPPRGANGVILEELTIQYKKEPPYTIPKTWTQLVNEQADGERDFAMCTTYTSVPRNYNQNPLGNEILLYQKNDNESTGSTAEDIVAIYGKPYYAGRDPGNGTVCLYYKYLDSNLLDETVYITFLFSKDRTENRLWGITIYGKENYMSDYSEEIVY